MADLYVAEMTRTDGSKAYHRTNSAYDNPRWIDDITQAYRFESEGAAVRTGSFDLGREVQIRAFRVKS